ncbi:MAG: four helix bundle protein [Gemmatimonadaceae bacterium]
MQDYRKLLVWRRSHSFVVASYAAIARFPRDERFELTSQLRRALVSIPANLAEGRSRRSERSFAAFIDIASGSAAEAEYLLFLAHEVGYLNAQDYAPLEVEIDEIRECCMRSGTTFPAVPSVPALRERRASRRCSTLTANG